MLGNGLTRAEVITMNADRNIEGCYAELTREATRLAGGLGDLAQRAAVYHHLFEASGRNHIFPLIAAHGALWARGYFGFCAKLAVGMSWQYVSPRRRRKQLDGVAAFADALRDINLRVCIDTYASYHFAERFGHHPQAVRFVKPELLAALNQIHVARRAGEELSDADKRAAFAAHFRNEQTSVVGPSVERAVAALDWPAVKWLAPRPVIRFAYFPRRCQLWFRGFDDQAERIEKGLRAFDLAAEVGWAEVESALGDYGVMPAAFFANSRRHFAAVRESVLAAA
jgi:hypothetical protein